MNVVLLEAHELENPRRVRLADRRHAHVYSVLRSQPGDELIVGQVGGRLGRGRVLAIDAAALELDVVLDRDPPPAAPVQLALALPRPPSLRKVLQQATALGVKQVDLLHSARVEKSYWQSSQLAPEALERQLRLGLEQARDTRLPRLQMHRRFGAFVDTAALRVRSGGHLLLAEAGAGPADPWEGPACLVVGPEGGFLTDELERLRDIGARPVGVGTRPLRVETAVVALLGALCSAG